MTHHFSSAGHVLERRKITIASVPKLQNRQIAFLSPWRECGEMLLGCDRLAIRCMSRSPSLHV
jgi:hypothetical protein